MSFFDIFNPSFFIFLGLLILVLACLILYFESKWREQNHKISSMVSLIGSLAEEMNHTKLVLSTINTQQNAFIPPHEIYKPEEELILVSDEEDNNSKKDINDDGNDSKHELILN